MDGPAPVVALGALLLAAAAYRRWHLRWGTTREERRAPMPGDEPGPGLLLTIPLLEIGDFPMMRKMLLGIRARAERVPWDAR